jgi:uncharacterized membrane protein
VRQAIVPVLAVALLAGASVSLPSVAAADDEVIEEADVVDVTPEQATPPLADKVSRMHPALVHMPIAWIFLLLFIDGATFFSRRQWAGAGVWILGLSVASCIPALVTGFLREDYMPKTAGAMIDRHSTFALATSAVLAVALVVRLLRRNRLEGGWKWAYLGLVIVAAVLVGMTGRPGGQIVFGPHFAPI